MYSTVLQNVSEIDAFMTLWNFEGGNEHTSGVFSLQGTGGAFLRLAPPSTPSPFVRPCHGCIIRTGYRTGKWPPFISMKVARLAHTPKKFLTSGFTSALCGP